MKPTKSMNYMLVLIVINQMGIGENGVAWPLLHKNKILKESSGDFTKFSIGGGLTIIFV